MNTETGQLRRLDKLTKDQLESGKWKPIPEGMEEKFKIMSRKERREYLRKNKGFRKGKFGFLGSMLEVPDVKNK